MATKVDKINAKMDAVLGVVNSFADNSGYGWAIDAVTRHNFAVQLVNAVEAVCPSQDDPTVPSSATSVSTGADAQIDIGEMKANQMKGLVS
jgi:hypothetical protein